MLKYLVHSLAIFLLSTSSIYAQEINAKKMSFGLHANVTAGKMLWIDGNINTANAFRHSFGLGASCKYLIDDKWYNASYIDMFNRRFAIATGGVVQTVNENGQWVAIQADHIDYQMNQISICTGIGYQIIKLLSFELTPYIQFSLSDQQLKIADVIKWRRADDFQQSFDFGVAGNLNLEFSQVYLKLSYQYGLRPIQEYSAYDANAYPLGKFQIRNTMAMVSLGYRF